MRMINAFYSFKELKPFILSKQFRDIIKLFCTNPEFRDLIVPIFELVKNDVKNEKKFIEEKD